MWIFLGITGLSGSGKDTFAHLIEGFVRAQGFQVYYKMLSDEVRNELNRRVLNRDAITRVQLIETGNELRSTYGGGVLASRTIVEYYQINKLTLDKRGLGLITGIRNHQEVETFRDEWKDRFILVSIDADLKYRNERLVGRNQYQEDFHQSQEIEKADEDIGIHGCQRMADYHISNNNSMEELSERATRFFDNYISAILNQVMM